MAAQLGSCATCCGKQAISRRPAEHLTAGIDGASVKAKRNALGQRRQAAILKGVSKDSEAAASCSESYGIPTEIRSKRHRRFRAAVAADPKPESPFRQMAKTGCEEWWVGSKRANIC
jgi:hypothetical protein